MKFFMFARLFSLFFVSVSAWIFAAPQVFAGTCTVLCTGAMVSGGVRSSSLSHSFEIGRRADCLNLCPRVCQNPPDSWVGVPRDGSASCSGPAVFSGAEAPAPAPVVDGTCEAVCGNDYLRETLSFNEPDRIRTPQECASRCQEVCSTRAPFLDTLFSCVEHVYHASRAAAATSTEAELDCPWWEQDGPEDGSGPATCIPSATKKNSNTKGTAGQRGTGSISASSGNCTFNGVHDPFCGKSIPQIIGNVVRFLLGAAGALFLAMFVYGGSVWLTAGSSDRHEDARKTLLNAAAGILIVIASYTIVSLLVRFAGGLGLSQSNEAPRLEGAGQEASSGARLPASGDAAPTGPGSCNAERFTTACREECRTSVLVGIAGRREECNTACGSYGPSICRAVRTPSDCGPGCTTLCASPEVPEIARGFCTSECGDLCAAAFR